MTNPGGVDHRGLAGGEGGAVQRPLTWSLNRATNVASRGLSAVRRTATGGATHIRPPRNLGPLLSSTRSPESAILALVTRRRLGVTDRS